MVESPAEVAFAGVGDSVVEESILARLVAVESEQVDEAPVGYFGECFLYVRVVADVAEEGIGVVNIFCFWGDIKITQPKHKVGGLEVFVKIFAESFEPVEFVLEFF